MEDTNADAIAVTNNDNVLVIPRLVASITDKQTGQTKQVSIRITDNVFCVCEENMSPSLKFIRCSQCDRKMHVKELCEFGMVPYKFKGDMYCSIACHLQQENYEVKIVAENKNKFCMKYKNGACAWVSRSQLNYAQYAKIYADWRKKHPEQEQQISDDDDVEIVSPPHSPIIN